MKKVFIGVLVLALLIGGGLWFFLGSGGEKRTVAAVEEKLGKLDAVDIRYEILSEDDNTLSRLLRSGRIEYLSRDGLSRIRFFGGSETTACAEAWMDGSDTVWNLRTGIDWLTTKTGTTVRNLSAKLLSGLMDSELTVSASQMRRVCDLFELKLPGGSLSAEVERLRRCAAVSGKPEKCELPDNTRMYGSIRNMRFFLLKTVDGDSFILGCEEDGNVIYLQKRIAGMQVEMLLSPSANRLAEDVTMPGTDKAEELVAYLENAKSEIFGALSSLPLIGKLLH